MRYYKLNNQYYSYNELHNTYGYTYTPTRSVTYLLVYPWGDSTQTINGYSVPTNVYSESSYFVENSIGWFTLNQLSINEGYFPSNVESTTLVRNGETSNVVFLSFADEPRYLIEKDLSVGWLTEQEYTERGWGKGTDVVLFLSPSGSGFNNTYNAITNTEDINGNNILFSDIDNTVPIEVFYFNTSSKKTYTDLHKNQPTYIVNNNSIAAWKSAGYYGNDRVYYASYCNDQNAELITLYKTPSYVRVPAYRLGSSYFILDGTHTSWVDDITVEGYTETPSQETCYVSGGTGPTLVNGQIDYYSGTRVYNNSGSIYRYNATKTYSVDSIYNKNGNLITGRTGTVRNDGTYITISVSGNTYLNAATVKLNITNLLPTVELFSVDGYKDYVYINNRGNAVSLQPNSTGDFYIIPISGGTGERTGYGSSKIYALSYWEYNEGELYNRVGIDVISNSGWLGWRSSSNWGFLRGKLYSCDSTSASVVTVYDSSNREYNAFTFTLSGTDYYYVLDEVQIAWTDDLNSIGYSLAAPSVSEYVIGALGSIASGDYKSTNTSYDSTKIYMFAGRDDVAQFVYRDVTCWEVFGNTGTAMVRNMTDSTINVAGSGMVATDKTHVIAINVYNSSNVAYPCFKFNGGQVKYWVWDGAHQYWTDDLASIGYSLTPAVVTA